MSPRVPLDFCSPGDAQQLGVSARTLRRWRALGSLPADKDRLRTLLVQGDLGSIAAPWSGWKLHGGDLWTPDGWSFSRGELLAVPLLYQQVAALEEDLARPSPVGTAPAADHHRP